MAQQEGTPEVRPRPFFQSTPGVLAVAALAASGIALVAAGFSLPRIWENIFGN